MQDKGELWLDNMRGRSLKDLRKRQRLINLQIEMAHAAMNDRALEDLQLMADCICEAILGSFEQP